ncbi:cky-1, partial [Pristionchus pacificus]
QINGEINRLRELLPLSDTSRERLFQLQVMSLACVYIRKEKYSKNNCDSTLLPFSPIDVTRTLPSFLIIVSLQGKLLYMSDNASEHIGHSVEELMCQGDNILDIIDIQDVSAVSSALASLRSKTKDQVSFICRMGLNRVAKRQIHQKFLLFSGHRFHSRSSSSLLAATVSPLLNPENIDCLSTGSTTVFTAKLGLDLKFTQLDTLGFEYFSISRTYLSLSSIYSLVHPEDVKKLEKKHRKLMEEPEGSVMILIRMITQHGEFTYFHVILTLTCLLPPFLPLLVSPEGTLLANAKTHYIAAAFQALTEEEGLAVLSKPSIYSTQITRSKHDESPLTPISPVDKRTLFNESFTPESISVHSLIELDISSHSLPSSSNSYQSDSTFMSPQSIPTLPELKHLDEYFNQVEKSSTISNASLSPPSLHNHPIDPHHYPPFLTKF